MSKAGAAREPSSSRAVPLYIAATTLVAVAVVTVSWVLHIGPPVEWAAVVTMLILGLLSSVFRERDVGSNITFSFLSIIIISSAVLIGPVGSALVGALSMGLERGKRSAEARIFNASMVALQGAVGGLVYAALGADLDSVTGAGDLLLRVGLPLMVADVVQMLINALLLAGIVRLSSGTPPRRFLVQMITNSGVAYIGYGIIGFLFVILWGPADVGWFSAVLILAPLYVARWAFVQYGEEQRAPRADAQRARHRRRDQGPLRRRAQRPHRARSPSGWPNPCRWERRTSRRSCMRRCSTTSARSGSRPACCDDRGPGRRRTSRRSPITRRSGVVLVREIEFLNGSLAGIRHHHERWDGLGYPDGLAGDEIPLISRVIAVADAFDALTTDRAERPAFAPQQALRQIEQRRGRQFDPHVVAALATVLERHDWPITSADEDELDRMRGYLDHDDPIAWEQVWATTPPLRPAVSGPGPTPHPVADEPSPPHPAAGKADDVPVAEQVRAP